MKATSKYSSIYWIITSITGLICVKLFLALFLNNYLEIIKEKNLLKTESDYNLNSATFI